MPSPFVTYALVFLALSFLGEIALIPVVYLSSTDVLNFGAVVGLMMIATVFSDSVWYILGKMLGRDALLYIPFIKKRKERFDHLSTRFEKSVIPIVFFSKFVHGTRAIVQILCGMHRIPYLTYIAASVSGAVAWTLLLGAVMFTVDMTLSGYKETAYYVQLSLLAFIVLAALLHYFLGRYIRRRWLGNGAQSHHAHGTAPTEEKHDSAS